MAAHCSGGPISGQSGRMLTVLLDWWDASWVECIECIAWQIGLVVKDKSRAGDVLFWVFSLS